jgi:drug/metabolite transporter (DMT)-like permease
LFFLSGSYKSVSLKINTNAIIILLIASFCYGIYERGKFVAAKYLDASVLSTITNISIFIAFIGSLILYSETLSLKKIFGSILIITALILLSTKNKGDIKSKKGIGFAIFISIMFGFAMMLDKLGTSYFGPSLYNVIVWTVPIIFVWFPEVKFSDLKKEIKNTSWNIVGLAILDVTAYFMQLKALQITEATRVMPIIQTSTIFTVILGIIILKEKDNVPLKLLSGIMATIGVCLLV